MENFEDEYNEYFDDLYAEETECYYDLSLVSNIDNYQKDSVAQAIKITNLEDTLYINDTATVFSGRVDAGMFGLHIKKNMEIDLGPFWRIFEQIEHKKNTRTMIVN